MNKVRSLSVVTVCLNCRDTINLTLESVKEQTFDRVEHVIIDGGSNDGTQEIVNTYGVDYFISEPDQGIYHAMEKGVAAATGDVIVFLNSGDLFIDPAVSADVVEYFNHTRSDIVFGDFLPYSINPDDHYDHFYFTPGKVCKLNNVKNRMQLADRNIHHQALFYKRKIFEKCSFFSDEWPEGSDYILNVQALVHHGFSAKYFNRIVSKFALGGVSTSNFAREQQQCSELINLINNKFFQKPIEYDSNEYVFTSAMPFNTRLKLLIKGALPFRVARHILDRLAHRIVDVLNVQLDFQVRTDSIYQRIDILASEVSEQHQFTTSLQEVLQQRTDSIYQQNENLMAAIGKLLQDSADLRQILHMRTDSIYQQIEKLSSMVREQREYAISLHHKMDVQSQKLVDTRADIDILQLNMSHLLNAAYKDENDISQTGYRIKSQFNEDGIIQYLVGRIRIPNREFVEFGVENYVEANTRLLVERDNWSGLVVDASADCIEQVKQSALAWKYGLRAVNSFVTCENINELIADSGISGDIGLLSIDIDGVDYWVWKAIDVISPRIVVCEYNSIFGTAAKVTVPYDPHFNRSEKHYSFLYAGASLGALNDLALNKGYTLVGGNSAGNNAFFVRDDCLDGLQPKSVDSVYIKAKFRESRDPAGNMTYLPLEEGIKLINDLPVFDLETQCERPIDEISIVYGM